MISKEILLIPGINKLSLININEYNIMKIIDIPNINSIIGIYMLNSTRDSNGIIRQWKIEGDNLILISLKENAHNMEIISLISKGDGHIASGSRDNLIKIW